MGSLNDAPPRGERTGGGPEGSWLLAALLPRSEARREARVAERLPFPFSGRTVRATAGAFEMQAVLSPGTRIIRGPGSGPVLVQHGEVTGFPDEEGGRRLLDRYRRGGPAALPALDGSFAFLVADEDACHVVTDRWSSRRVFHGVRGGVHWLASAGTLPFHPLARGCPDPAGVGHYLANGVPFAGRTPFAGLRWLRRASVHTLLPDGVRSREHGRLEVGGREEGREEARLRDRLYELVLAAVQKRARGDEIRLALSGGWDSSTILGALSVLGIEGVRAFSYVDGRLRPGTDAAVARNACRALGYEHVTFPGYRDDFLRSLEGNLHTRGTCQFVLETDAWREVAGWTRKAAGRPVLLLGDQGVGSKAMRFLATPRDALYSLGIQGLERLGPLREALPVEARGRIEEELESDLDAILAKAPPLDDPRDVRHWLYLDQITVKLLGWREFFARRAGVPRYPLLDSELVEFAAGLPIPLRSDKRLLREMARARFPAVFRGPRATRMPTLAAWGRSALAPARDELVARVREEPSPLDEYVPPELLVALLEGAPMANPVLRSREKLRSRARRLLQRVPGGVRAGRRLGLAERRPVLRSHQFLVRALYLRTLFRCSAPPGDRGVRPPGR